MRSEFTIRAGCRCWRCGHFWEQTFMGTIKESRDFLERVTCPACGLEAGLVPITPDAAMNLYQLWEDHD